jgi:hypothetical protein
VIRSRPPTTIRTFPSRAPSTGAVLELWSVQIGEMTDVGNVGVPPVPTTVFEGDEDGARTAYTQWSGKAESAGYRYVMLRRTGEVVELWGTPPAVG